MYNSILDSRPSFRDIDEAVLLKIRFSFKFLKVCCCCCYHVSMKSVGGGTSQSSQIASILNRMKMLEFLLC